MKLVIVVPFQQASVLTASWAIEEELIDFRREPGRAARCTTAYAATELKSHLIRTIRHASIEYNDIPPLDDPFIELRIMQHDSLEDTFSIEPCCDGRGILITGLGRTGLLYGAYELLRMQGWNWYAPGSGGEYVPDMSDTLLKPINKMSYSPSMKEGRGFDFVAMSQESAAMIVWMARNRMNIGAYRPSTIPLSRKLGMQIRAGGHIFEHLLDPDLILPSGATLWETHENWYGLPPDGIRVKERAQSIQFCVSQSDLRDYLGDKLIDYVTGKWKDADRVDVWGFDTWGNVCTCDACTKLGNATDQMLFFIGAMRDKLNQAIQTGKLDHKVRLIVCAYEGTCTLEGPSRPYPANLMEAEDMIVYYPINRCYAHHLGDPDCPDNRKYLRSLHDWCSIQPPVPIVFGEYYNVSKMEDLPLLFTSSIGADLPAYHRMGVRAMTYMHIPMVGWAMRTLTQHMYAQLSWNVATDQEKYLNNYYSQRYGTYAGTIRSAYEKIEQAWLHITDWRAWKSDCVLSSLLMWDGQKPNKPLPANRHLGTQAEIIAAGHQSIQLMQQAYTLIHVSLQDNKLEAAKRYRPASNKLAVNPEEARAVALSETDPYELRLSEDKRLLLYGLLIMQMMTLLTEYHYELYNEKTLAQTEPVWTKIEETADRLDQLYIPISYEWRAVGLEVKDALSRSQVRGLLRKCRAARLQMIR